MEPTVKAQLLVHSERIYILKKLILLVTFQCQILTHELEKRVPSVQRYPRLPRWCSRDTENDLSVYSELICMNDLWSVCWEWNKTTNVDERRLQSLIGTGERGGVSDFKSSPSWTSPTNLIIHCLGHSWILRLLPLHVEVVDERADRWTLQVFISILYDNSDTHSFVSPVFFSFYARPQTHPETSAISPA